jgi:hypothetical protein
MGILLKCKMVLSCTFIFWWLTGLQPFILVNVLFIFGAVPSAELFALSGMKLMPALVAHQIPELSWNVLSLLYHGVFPWWHDCHMFLKNQFQFLLPTLGGHRALFFLLAGP